MEASSVGLFSIRDMATVRYKAIRATAGRTIEDGEVVTAREQQVCQISKSYILTLLAEAREAARR